MFTEILNSFLNVRNKVKDADGNWVDQTKPRETQHVEYINFDFEENETVVFEEFGNKIIIDSLEFTTNSRGDVYPRLNTQPEATGRTSNNLLMAINSDTGAVWDATVLYINDYGNNFLDAIVHNRSDDDYKVILRKPIVLPEGGRLVFRSNSSNVDNVTALVTYRVIEE